MAKQTTRPERLKTDDLKQRCYALRDAVSKRGMGKSGLMHTAANHASRPEGGSVSGDLP